MDAQRDALNRVFAPVTCRRPAGPALPQHRKERQLNTYDRPNANARTEAVDSESAPLSPDQLQKMNAYWRACNYLSVGMIYLRDKPVVARTAASPSTSSSRLLGHWGSDPGQSFAAGASEPADRQAGPERDVSSRVRVMAHRRRSRIAISKATTPKSIPTAARTAPACCRLFRQFSFPGGIGSHCTPETPGSIHEGGELGYSLSHGFGAAFDNPGSDRRGDDRRRRSGNRPARHLVALEQISQPDAATARCLPVLASERLQDRQSDHSRAHSARGTRSPVDRLWLQAVFRRRRRSRRRCISDGATLEQCIGEIRAIQRMRVTTTTRRGRAGQ